MVYRRVIILILILASIGLFCYLNLSAVKANNYSLINSALAADVPGTLINEIAWMGTEVSANDEWIELKNMAGVEMSLEGWALIAQDGSPSINLFGSIPAGGYFLFERSNDDSVPEITADLIYTGALGNSGEILELRDSGGILIDSIDASEGWPVGDNTTKQTMERAEDGSWQDSQSAGGTPKQKNSIPPQDPGGGDGPEPMCGNGILEDGDPSTGSGQEKCDDGNNINGDGCDSECLIEQPETKEPATTTPEQVEKTVIEETVVENQSPIIQMFKLGDVLINEFVADPTDEEIEWIELYNTLDFDINLEGWTITEGSGAKTTLKDSIGSSEINRFFIIEKPKGNLNNPGDIIILKDNTGALIDRAAYGNWDDGNAGNNAPKASDPYSLARKIDGYNSFNNLNDFAVTTSPTKGASNIITLINDKEDNEISPEEKRLYDYSDDIIISEIYPNPSGSDNPDEPEQGEFIELYNAGKDTVDLTGWNLGDETKKKYKLTKPPSGSKSHSVALRPGAYLVIYRADSKIALNNTSDSVKLYQPLKDEPLAAVKYEKAKEGWSYNIKEAKLPIGSLASRWTWGETPTPGQQNIIKAVNHPPIVDFDCPDSAFAAKPIIFDSSDTVDEDGDTLTYFWNFGDGFTNTLSSPEHTFFNPGSYVVSLIVNDGGNKTEKEKIITIIESNINPENVDVLGWEQSSANIIINEFMPNPEGRDEEGEYVELYNKGETRVNLLNWQLDDSESGSRPYTIIDSLWLDAGGRLTISREESGLALNNTFDSVRLFNNNSELIDEVEYEKASEGEAYARGENNKWFWTTTPTPNDKNIIRISDSSYTEAIPQNSAKKQKSVKEKITITTTPELARNLDPGDRVIIKGTVAVKPGILGTQYFYIVGSPGIQVYNYKKDFPELRIGDFVEINGELAVSGGEWRVKTKTAADINFIEHRESPAPLKLACDKITEETVGSLITVTGEVVEKKGSSIYLDDNSDEIKLYIRNATGINTKRIREGDRIAATGILNRTKSGLRLMPRSSEDIVKKDIETTEVGQVLGEITANDEWEIAFRDKKLELFKYLLIIAGTVIIILTGLLFKLNQKA